MKTEFDALAKRFLSDLNLSFQDEDYMFEYEGSTAQLIDEFQIKLID